MHVHSIFEPGKGVEVIYERSGQLKLRDIGPGWELLAAS